ncbi:MAG: pilus assembly protein TadG-related protein, partial [Pseudodonghicola sp.]
MTLFVVMLLPGVLLLGGLAVDLSQLNAQKLYAQGQADLAAQSAASRLYNLDEARSLAEYVVRSNRQYGEISLETGDVIFGSFNPSTGFVAAADQSDPTGVNAVKVTVAMPWYAFLWSAFVPKDSRLIARSAVARTEGAYAAFTLRNRLLSVHTDESPLLAPLLDALLGKDRLGVDLDVLGYTGLADATVNINKLLNLVSLNVDAGVATFGDVLDLPIDTGVLLETLLEAAGLDPSLVSDATGKISLGQLLSLSPQLLEVKLGDILPDLNIGLYDLLTTAAGLAGSDPTERLAVDLGLDLSPLANVQLKTGLIRSPVTFAGPVSDEDPLTGSISQLDLALQTQILNLGVPLLNLSLSLSAADATATLVDLNCDATEDDDIVATFEVQSSAASLGLALSLFAPINGDDGKQNKAVPLAPSVQTIYIRKDEIGVPVAVPGTILLDSLITSLGDVLRGLTNSLVDDRDRWSICKGPLSCLINLVLVTVDELVSHIANLLDLIAKLFTYLIPVNELAENLLTLLGIDTARVDII